MDIDKVTLALQVFGLFVGLDFILIGLFFLSQLAFSRKGKREDQATFVILSLGFLISGAIIITVNLSLFT